MATSTAASAMSAGCALSRRPLNRQKASVPRSVIPMSVMISETTAVPEATISIAPN